jgi:hypothetical protein
VRGLDKIDGKSTATPATGHAPQGGVGDGTGAAPLDPNTQQASTAAPRADPTARGDAADTRHPADRGTASATANDTHCRTPEQYHDEQTAARDRRTAVDDPSVQRDTDVRQQGNGTVTSDRDKETRTTADTSFPANAAGQEHPFGTASQA